MHDDKALASPSCYWASHLRLAQGLAWNANEQPVRPPSWFIAIDIDLIYHAFPLHHFKLLCLTIFLKLDYGSA